MPLAVALVGIAYVAAFITLLLSVSVGIAVGLLFGIGFAAVGVFAWATM